MGIRQSLSQLAATLDVDKIDNLPTVSANTVLNNGLNIAYFIAGVICVIVIIIAAMTYITSGGQPNAVAKSKMMILYAVIGLVVVFIAFAITWFVIGRIN